MKIEVCNQKGCTNQAVLEVRLSLAVHDKHPPAISTPLVKVCALHSDIKWEEVVTPDGWERICQGFAAMGRQKPLREFSKLVLYPITKDNQA